MATGFKARIESLYVIHIIGRKMPFISNTPRQIRPVRYINQSNLLLQTKESLIKINTCSFVLSFVF